MIRKFALFALMLMALFALPGCQEEEPLVETPPGAEEPFTTELEGNWRTACFNDGTDDLDDQVTFTGTSYEEKITGYLDATCADIQFETRYVGTFTTGATDLLPDGNNYVEADWLPTNIYQKPYNALVAISWNLLSYCGFTDWSAGVEKEITALVNVEPGCVGSTPNLTYLGIYSIQNGGTDLYLADILNAAADPTVTRVMDLMLLPYVKQP